MRPTNRNVGSRAGLGNMGNRRSRDIWGQLYRAVAAHAGVLTAVCAVTVFSGVYFVAIQKHSVELSFDQLSAFERQVQTVGNRSVYVVEAGQRDDVLSSLARDDWARVSSNIDYVAFVYGDVTAVTGGGLWLGKVDAALEGTRPRGYGVVLFSCGCVMPNLVFTETKTRFQGSECTMLPGFVLGKESVRFVDVPVAEGRCRNRDKVLSGPWYENNAWKLDEARAEHAALRKRLETRAA